MTLGNTKWPLAMFSALMFMKMTEANTHVYDEKKTWNKRKERKNNRRNQEWNNNNWFLTSKHHHPNAEWKHAPTSSSIQPCNFTILILAERCCDDNMPRMCHKPSPHAIYLCWLYKVPLGCVNVVIKPKISIPEVNIYTFTIKTQHLDYRG